MIDVSHINFQIISYDMTVTSVTRDMCVSNGHLKENDINISLRVGDVDEGGAYHPCWSFTVSI